MDASKPLIKHCMDCGTTKEADRNKEYECFCNKCGVQMVEEYELELKKQKKKISHLTLFTTGSG